MNEIFNEFGDKHKYKKEREMMKKDGFSFTPTVSFKNGLKIKGFKLEFKHTFGQNSLQTKNKKQNLVESVKETFNEWKEIYVDGKSRDEINKRKMDIEKNIESFRKNGNLNVASLEKKVEITRKNTENQIEKQNTKEKTIATK